VPRAIVAPVLIASACAAACSFPANWLAWSSSQYTATRPTTSVTSTASAKARSTRRRAAAPGTAGAGRRRRAVHQANPPSASAATTTIHPWSCSQPITAQFALSVPARPPELHPLLSLALGRARLRKPGLVGGVFWSEGCLRSSGKDQHMPQVYWQCLTCNGNGQREQAASFFAVVVWRD
jgi:hypothetical protein